MRRLSTVLAAAMLGALATGCRDGHYGHAELTQQRGDGTAILDLNASIQMNEGSACSIDVNLHARDGDVLPGDLQSADPSVLQIGVTPTDSNRYVFLAVKAGTTQVAVTAKGQQVATVPVTILAPPPFVEPAAIDAGPGSLTGDAAGPPDGDASLDGSALSDASDGGGPG